MTARIAILHGSTHGETDAIRDCSFLLADALSEVHGNVAEVYVNGWSGSVVTAAAEWDRRARLLSSPDQLADYDLVLVQYNPFSYGRWGFAPGLMRLVRALHRGPRRPRIALFIHEPYVPFTTWQSLFMGSWQRVQLAALRLAADTIFASIECWTDEQRRARPRRPVFHQPMGSTLPDRRDRRQEARRQLGIGDAAVVVAAFGTGHPSRLVGLIVDSANGLARRGHPVVLLNLGAGAPRLAGLDQGIALHQPGKLAPEEIALHLSAGDIFVAPFIDGVSTRRTTVMAALQHGLAVVGTDGPLTDGTLREASHALCLVPLGERGQLSEAVIALAESAPERERQAEAGRKLYREQFDWPVAAQRLLIALELSEQSRDAS